jgi:hypothetical protein
MKNTRRLMERRGVILYLWRGLYILYYLYNIEKKLHNFVELSVPNLLVLFFQSILALFYSIFVPPFHVHF